jgi:predicted ATP-dependent serine protease
MSTELTEWICQKCSRLVAAEKKRCFGCKSWRYGKRINETVSQPSVSEYNAVGAADAGGNHADGSNAEKNEGNVLAGREEDVVS